MQQLREKIHFQGTVSEAEKREYASLRGKLIELILSCEAEELLEWTPLEGEPPQPARIRPSIVCDRCGEEVMETRIQRVGDKNLCIPCRENPD